MARTDDPQSILQQHRTKIDAIDEKLLRLLSERGSIAREIGAVKRLHGLPVVEPSREKQVVSNMVSANSGPLPAASVERIFSRIMIEMRNLQNEGSEEC